MRNCILINLLYLFIYLFRAEVFLSSTIGEGMCSALSSVCFTLGKMAAAPTEHEAARDRYGGGGQTEQSVNRNSTEQSLL